jgi:hypothetical protein
VQLQGLLGSAYSVEDFGVSGTTMLKNGDNPYWNQTTTFTNARTFLPNIVVIELGTNDSKPYNWYVHQAAFNTDYASMIDTFRVLSSAPKVWACLAPYSNNSSWGILDTSITLRINPAILTVALQKAANVIDLQSTFTDRTELQSDTVHPDSAGAAAIAAIVKGYFLRDTLRVQKSGAMLNAPAGYGYQWYLNSTLLTGDTNQSLSISALGNYSVSVKVDANTQSRIVSKVLAVTNLTDTVGTPSHSSSSSSAASSSSAQTSAILSTALVSPAISIQGNELRVDLVQAGSVAIYFYDIQGQLLQSLMLQGLAGLNHFKLPAGHGLQIVEVQAVGQVQSFVRTVIPIRK